MLWVQMAKKPLPAIKKTEISADKYAQFISSLKAKIRSSQIKAAVAVNRELIKLYWEIGEDIVEKQEKESWGSKVLERVAQDLQNEFPGIEGFSRANIFRMKAFFSAYEKVAQAVRQFESLPIFNIPWGHNILLLQKIKDNTERLWYASKAIEHGWSRSMLTIWMFLLSTF
jgi:predicted nuclease of restriction endonuclease-like (RecB) superfamily